MLPLSPSATDQVYRTAKGYRILIYVLIPPLALVFMAMPFLMMHGKDPTVGAIIGFGVLGIGLAGLCLYALLETAKSCFVISNEQVQQVGAFKTESLQLSEIKGYRSDDKYTRIYPLNKQLPTLKIGYTTEQYGELQRWLATRYPNLDEVETAQATALLMEDHDLGRTPEERAEALDKAKKVGLVLNIAGGAVGAWLVFYPHPYDWAIAAGLLLPVAATVALWLLPNTLRVDEKKNSGYPSVIIAFLGPCLGLLLRALFDYEILNHAPMWPLVGTTAAGAALLLAIGSRQFLFRRSEVGSVGLTIVVWALLYGYGATSIVNATYDEATPVTFTPQVLGKRISSGKHTSYYLKVSPWGPVPTAEDVEVSRSYYQKVEQGQQVTVALWPGRLGVPWFTVLE